MKEPSAAIMSDRGDVRSDSELYDYYCWHALRLAVESVEGGEGGMREVYQTPTKG